MDRRFLGFRKVLLFTLLATCLHMGELQGDDELRANYERRLAVLANLHAEFTVEHHRVVPSEEEIEALRERLPPHLGQKKIYPMPANEEFDYRYRRGNLRDTS